MRKIAIAVLLQLVLTATAVAQNVEGIDPLPPAGRAMAPSVPGENVDGMVLQPNGLFTWGDIYVEGVYEDDLFAYWVGSYQNQYYYYDPYNADWKPGPVVYRRAFLDFQGQQVEGWIRNFGGFADGGHFFGQDGALYRRVTVDRKNDDGKRETVHTYFFNVATLERSDGREFPFDVTQMQGIDEQYIDQMLEQEEAITSYAEQNPGYANWRDEFPEGTFTEAPPAEPPPGTATEPSLKELIEQEIGPLDTEEPVNTEEPAAEETAEEPATEENAEDQE